MEEAEDWLATGGGRCGGLVEFVGGGLGSEEGGERLRIGGGAAGEGLVRAALVDQGIEMSATAGMRGCLYVSLLVFSFVSSLFDVLRKRTRVFYLINYIKTFELRLNLNNLHSQNFNRNIL